MAIWAVNAVSTNYRELTSPEEIQQVADDCVQAWTDYMIPLRQWEIVKPELDALRNGKPCAPFVAFIECLRHLPQSLWNSRPRLLDVGASSGYYREVLKIADYDMHYTGIDFSLPFERFARTQYPDIDFDLGDACSLPYHDDFYDVVLSGATIMHCREYEKAITEAARVSQRYVIFHRTPIVFDYPTRFFVKEGYGVPMLEIHFNETDLLLLFDSCGLQVIYNCDIFRQVDLCHRTYLLEKQSEILHHPV